MITPAWRIRDCAPGDMDTIRALFTVEGFGDLSDPANVRVAETPDGMILGALRCEQGSDGHWNVRPIVVWPDTQHGGVGTTLLKDALKLHPDMYLVSRGSIEPFYLACGFERCGWDEIAPEYRRECNLCPDSAACGPIPFHSKPETFELTFLGTSSGCGVPAFFCHCKSCEDARRDPRLRRGCTGVVVRSHHTVLIDTPPDLRHQLIRENVRDIDEVFLTHAHFDHLGGFGELEYLVRLYRDTPLPFHASGHALGEAMAEFFYMDDCFDTDPMEDFECRNVGQLRIQALPLNHAPGTFGYLLTTPAGTRTFYAPDTAALRDDVIEILRGVDNLIMDSSFWGDTGNFKTHHSVQQTIDEGLNLLNAGHVYLTHLAPHICEPDVNVIAEIREHIKQYDGRVVLAEDGMKTVL